MQRANFTRSNGNVPRESRRANPPASDKSARKSARRPAVSHGQQYRTASRPGLARIAAVASPPPPPSRGRPSHTVMSSAGPDLGSGYATSGVRVWLLAGWLARWRRSIAHQPGRARKRRRVRINRSREGRPTRRPLAASRPRADTLARPLTTHRCSLGKCRRRERSCRGPSHKTCQPTQGLAEPPGRRTESRHQPRPPFPRPPPRLVLDRPASGGSSTRTTMRRPQI